MLNAHHALVTCKPIVCEDIAKGQLIRDGLTDDSIGCEQGFALTFACFGVSSILRRHHQMYTDRKRYILMMIQCCDEVDALDSAPPCDGQSGSKLKYFRQ